MVDINRSIKIMCSIHLEMFGFIPFEVTPSRSLCAAARNSTFCVCSWASFHLPRCPVMRWLSRSPAIRDFRTWSCSSAVEQLFKGCENLPKTCSVPSRLEVTDACREALALPPGSADCSSYSKFGSLCVEPHLVVPQP